MQQNALCGRLIAWLGGYFAPAREDSPNGNRGGTVRPKRDWGQAMKLKVPNVLINGEPKKELEGASFDFMAPNRYADTPASNSRKFKVVPDLRAGSAAPRMNGVDLK